MLTAGSASFGVQHKFLYFYLEIDELRRAASLRKAPDAADGAIAKLPEHSFAAEIRRKAEDVLNRQYLDMLNVGSMAAATYREALLVMAAFADEVFIHLDWEGSQYWLSHLLETQYFRTQSAGEVFFRNISVLLTDNDPARDELRILYLTALALGFRGQYAARGKSESEAVARGLREKLYARIKLPTAPAPNLYLANGGSVQRRGSPLRWWAIALGAVFLWLSVSTIIWDGVSSGVRSVLDAGRDNSGSQQRAGYRKQ